MDSLITRPWLTNLFEDRSDGDSSRFECRNVTKLIINGVVTFRIPPRKLYSPVDAARFTWKSGQGALGSHADLYLVQRYFPGTHTSF